MLKKHDAGKRDVPWSYMGRDGPDHQYAVVQLHRLDQQLTLRRPPPVGPAQPKTVNAAREKQTKLDPTFPRAFFSQAHKLQNRIQFAGRDGGRGAGVGVCAAAAAAGGWVGGGGDREAICRRCLSVRPEQMSTCFSHLATCRFPSELRLQLGAAMRGAGKEGGGEWPG